MILNGQKVTTTGVFVLLLLERNLTGPILVSRAALLSLEVQSQQIHRSRGHVFENRDTPDNRRLETH